MTTYENQIIDLEKLITLSVFDDGTYQDVGCIFFPKGYTHNHVKFYRYQGFNKFREDYDFACLSFETLQDHLGVDIILFQNHRPTIRTNKACLFQVLSEAYSHLNHTEYVQCRMAIEDLPYYTLE